MKRYFLLTITKPDADIHKAVYDEIERLDPKTRIQRPDDYTAWVVTSLTEEQLKKIMWVTRVVQAGNGTVNGRQFLASLPNKMSDASSYIIEAVQEWMNRDTWESSWEGASDCDLSMKFELRRDSDPIGDIKYDLRLNDYFKRRHIARYESLEAALDTLFDMGAINAKTKRDALRVHEEGGRGGKFT